LSIYDDAPRAAAEGQHHHERPMPSGPVYDAVVEARGLANQVLDKTLSTLEQVQQRVDRIKRFQQGVLTRVPAEERNPVGLGVIALAALTGTYTYPKRPFFRAFVAVPVITGVTAAVCYPETMYNFVATGMAHSGAPTSVPELRERLPSIKQLPQLARRTVEQAPTLEEVSGRMTSFYDSMSSKIASAPQPSNPEASSSVTPQADEPTTTALVTDETLLEAASAEPTVATEAASDSLDESDSTASSSSADPALHDVILATADATGQRETDIEPDFGQACKDDMDTYISRR